MGADPRDPVQRDPGSYRDPGGFVYRRDGVLLRQVGESLVADWEAFAARRWLPGSSSRAGSCADAAPPELAATPDARAVIRPGAAPVHLLLYEWTFGQLRTPRCSRSMSSSRQ
jgi:hypothetical protein